MDRTYYLKDLHGFRGFAIINIVVVHVFAVYFLNSDQINPLSDAAANLWIANEVLFHSSTIYFALISGLLFSKVLAGRSWRDFFQSKLKNVILPYALMTLFFSLVWYDASNCTWRSACAGESLVVTFEGATPFVELFVSNLVRGATIVPYWYIPVLACLFLATPLLYSLARKAPKSLIAIAILPLFVSRTGIDVTFESVIYFVGVYSVGMYLGLNYEKNLSQLKKHLWFLTTLAISTSAALWIVFSKDLEFIGPVSLRESLFYIQKLSLSGLVLVFLNRWEDRLPNFLDILGTYAFAIYFIHLFVLLPLIGITLNLRPPPISAVEIVLSGAVVLIAVLIISTIVSMGFRKILGKRSRLVIGA